MSQRDVVAMNVMISGLCRCHLTADAIQLFENMPERDVGSWNALISGLGRKSQGGTALFYFRKMRSECNEIDVMTMVSVLSVCADLAALSNGKQVHGLVIQHGFEGRLPIGNATLDMYAKSGCMEDACVSFNKMPFRNVISWTSLIAGYGRHGLGLNALTAFEQMELEGIVPNNLTFLSTLYACSHAGLIPQGWRTFNTMISKYSMTPRMEHYTCMVDLLARAGHVKEALNLIETMPMKPDARLLTAVLSHCCNHHNWKLSKIVGLKLLELGPREAGAYMLLSNFYGRVGDFGGVANVRRLMLNRGVRKEKAYTWIEIHRTVHCFESGDSL
ncbi:E motif [Dillenia turbinata]|uniref:E motif n=1 Tax=Dillenia turbinata TaxID=194707 RepID=A0AAN8VDA4_9MAGN